FANNITLNPGATYNYSGTQFMSRAGNYNFFVAYQKTDGSWITSVPTDAGVTNTANVTVASTCGTTANPMVSSSLVISGQTCVNQTLTAQFSITNRGNAPITFQRLTAAARLNNYNLSLHDALPISFANNITLNPLATYNYSGTQFMNR